MKRSETVLVYGVTGLLLVILVVAVVFGNEGQAGQETGRVAGAGEQPTAGPGEAGPAAKAAKSLADLIDDPAGPEGKPIVGTDDPAEPDDTEAKPTEPPVGDVALNRPVRTVETLLGANRVVERYGAKFRVVTVQSRDTLSGLVEAWCADTDGLDLVRAMNEEVDPERLRPGEEVWLPYVEEQALLDAYDRRALRRASAPPVANRVPTAPVRAAVPATGSRTHVVRSGESLWTIAVGHVGARDANAYIAEILRLNPQIGDPNRIRAKTTISLP